MVVAEFNLSQPLHGSIGFRGRPIYRGDPQILCTVTTVSGKDIGLS